MSFSICEEVYDFFLRRRNLISMRVVREMVPKTDLSSTSFTISYGASQSFRPDAVSVSCISQLTTASVSRSILGPMNYFLTFPYDVLLNSRTNSVDVFPSGSIFAYFPRRASETFRRGFEDFCNFLSKSIASFKVEDMSFSLIIRYLNLTYGGRSVKKTGIVGSRDRGI